VSVSREAIAVAGLSAIAIATSGCSGGSESEAEKFRAAFKETFGTPPHERPWYHLITGMKMSSVNSRWLERPAPGRDLRAAMNVEAGDGIEAVRVMGPDGVEQGGCA